MKLDKIKLERMQRYIHELSLTLNENVIPTLNGLLKSSGNISLLEEMNAMEKPPKESKRAKKSK